MASKVFKFDFEEAKKRSEYNSLYLDLTMLLVVFISLIVIIFNWHFQFDFIQSFFKYYFPVFYDLYLPVHKNFILYDSVFVAIFLIELFIRWVVAAAQKKYHKWFWYPFIHWYDVLGSIPLGGFRFLRLLRIISVIIRLEKLGLINIKESYLSKVFSKYYEILVEEVSDRVVLNVLTNVQEEIKDGNQVVNNIVKDVITPKKEQLVNWFSEKLKSSIAETYDDELRDKLKNYISQSIQDSMENNPEFIALKNTPIIGNTISEKLESAVSGITFGTIDGLITSMASDKNKVAVSETLNMFLDSILKEGNDKELNKITNAIVHDSIEVIKDDVRIEKWKVKEEKMKLMRERAKSIKNATKQD